MTAVVLVADADPFRLRLLDEACAALGFEVISALDGRQVLDIVARQPPQVLVLHATLDDPPCAEVVEVLRADRDLAGIPVVAIGEPAAPVDRVVPEPPRVAAIQAGVTEALRSARDRRRRQRESMAPAEPGTSAQLRVTLDYELAHAARFGRPLSALTVRTKDDPGAGRALRASLRSADLIFRAGDVFVVLLPDTDAEGAAVASARLRKALGSAAEILGVATAPAPGLGEPEAFLAAARGER